MINFTTDEEGNLILHTNGGRQINLGPQKNAPKVKEAKLMGYILDALIDNLKPLDDKIITIDDNLKIWTKNKLNSIESKLDQIIAGMP